MEGSPLPLALGFLSLDPEEQDGWWAAKRKVHAGTEGDDMVYLALQLGDSMLLDGRGQRGGLRCRSFDGIVWDVGRVANGDRPRELGHFIMRLALPIKTDTAMLESQYDKRTRLRRERAANCYVPPSAAPSEPAGPEEEEEEEEEEETLRERVERTAAALQRAEAEAEAAFAEVQAAQAKFEAGEARAKEAQANAGAARYEAQAARAELAEEEAKRAWLEKLNAPIWGRQRLSSRLGEDVDDPEEETRDSAPYAS